MDSNGTSSEVREFLETYIPDSDFTDDDDIFELGLVNSLMAMQLVMFLEKQYGLKLAGDDLDFANFRSVSKISALVGSKLVEK